MEELFAIIWQDLCLTLMAFAIIKTYYNLFGIPNEGLSKNALYFS